MKEPQQAPDLIGQSPAFLDALAKASAAAALNRPLLIVGERGSGKELIAGRIHFLSPRWEGPFIKVNCAALSEDLLESELFGHEPGAFTGAQKRHLGRFERADAGTLFLDEIASASMRVQEKLLRVIEYGEFERLGGGATMTADVRVIAAANVDLPAMALANTFRADLLDRLAFDVIRAPPLRERPEDIARLAAHFGARMARELDAAYEGFTPAALAQLTAHHWPGNVRELKNVAERSVHRWIAAGGAGPIDAVVIDPFAVGGRTPPVSAPLPVPDDACSDDTAAYDLRARLDALERDAVRAALDHFGNSQARAAAHLGLTYDQMRGLVRKHGLATRQRRSAMLQRRDELGE